MRRLLLTVVAIAAACLTVASGYLLIPRGRPQMASPQRKFRFDPEKLTLGGQPGNVMSIRAFSVSADGKRLALCSRGDKGLVRVWDLVEGRVIRSFPATDVPILCLAASSDGNWIVSSGAEPFVRLWDAVAGEQLRIFEGFDAPIEALAVSSNDRLLVTGHQDGTIRQWNLATGEEIRHFQAHTGRIRTIALSQDCQWLVTAGDDQTARLWELSTCRQSRIFQRGPDKNNPPRHGDPIRSVALSADGKWLATAGDDECARLWDVATGKLTRSFMGHGAAITTVALSGDNSLLLTGSEDRLAALWDTATGVSVHDLAGHTASVRSTAFLADGKFVLTGSDDESILLWDAGTGLQLCRLITFRRGGWAVYDTQNRFDVSQKAWTAGNSQKSLSILGQQFYDPGLLAKYLGHNSEPLRPLEGE